MRKRAAGHDDVPTPAATPVPPLPLSLPLPPTSSLILRVPFRLLSPPRLSAQPTLLAPVLPIRKPLAGGETQRIIDQSAVGTDSEVQPSGPTCSRATYEWPTAKLFGMFESVVFVTQPM